MKKKSYIVSNKYTIYTKKDLVQAVTVKNIKKLKTIAIILENSEELLLIFVI